MDTTRNAALQAANSVRDARLLVSTLGRPLSRAAEALVVLAADAAKAASQAHESVGRMYELLLSPSLPDAEFVAVNKAIGNAPQQVIASSDTTP
jgi:hypothetical protein